MWLVSVHSNDALSDWDVKYLKAILTHFTLISEQFLQGGGWRCTVSHTQTLIERDDLWLQLDFFFKFSITEQSTCGQSPESLSSHGGTDSRSTADGLQLAMAAPSSLELVYVLLYQNQWGCMMLLLLEVKVGVHWQRNCKDWRGSWLLLIYWNKAFITSNEKVKVTHVTC